MMELSHPERWLHWIHTSQEVLTAVYRDIMNDPQKKSFVLDLLKGVATIQLAKRVQATIQPATVTPQQVVLNGHVYPGRTLRRFLTQLLLIIVTAAGLTGAYLSRDRIQAELEPWIRRLDLPRVLDFLQKIVAAAVAGLSTASSAAAAAFRQALKRVRVDRKGMSSRRSH